LDFAQSRISEQDFKHKSLINMNSNSILKLLNCAYNEKNPEDVEYALIVAYKLNLISDEYINILCNLLDCDWHYKHEDIARTLQRLKSSSSIETLFRTVYKKYKYLEYDDCCALTRKCIWALDDINTVESKEKLKLISTDKTLNEEIRDYATNQLNKKR